MSIGCLQQRRTWELQTVTQTMRLPDCNYGSAIGLSEYAFDFYGWPLHWQTKEKFATWLESFRGMRKLVVLLDTRQSGLKDDREFVLPDRKTLQIRGGDELSWLLTGMDNLKKAETELGVRLPRVESVFAASKGKEKET
jgi:hypothetical protein